MSYFCHDKTSCEQNFALKIVKDTKYCICQYYISFGNILHPSKFFAILPTLSAGAHLQLILYSAKDSEYTSDRSPFLHKVYCIIYKNRASIDCKWLQLRDCHGMTQKVEQICMEVGCCRCLQHVP